MGPRQGSAGSAGVGGSLAFSVGARAGLAGGRAVRAAGAHAVVSDTESILLPEGAAWCMMQHPVSKRGRPSSGWVTARPARHWAPGRTAGHGAGSGWVDAHRTRRASGRPSLTWRTTEHPTPPRGPQRVIGRASGASFLPGGRWVVLRRPVGDGSSAPCDSRGAHLYSSLETPGSSPGLPPPLTGSPTVGYLGKFPPHPHPRTGSFLVTRTGLSSR